MSTQQEVLRELAKSLGLSQKELAKRMGVSWATFEKWLYPADRGNARKLPPIGWKLVDEILAHESLKKDLNKLQSRPMGGV